MAGQNNDRCVWPVTCTVNAYRGNHSMQAVLVKLMISTESFVIRWRCCCCCCCCCSFLYDALYCGLCGLTTVTMTTYNEEAFVWQKIVISNFHVFGFTCLTKCYPSVPRMSSALLLRKIYFVFAHNLAKLRLMLCVYFCLQYKWTCLYDFPIQFTLLCNYVYRMKLDEITTSSLKS